MKYAGWTYFGDYEPKNPKHLNEVPKEIREKVVAHLTNRLGRTFFSRMKFSGGQIVDRKALLLVNPNAKNYQWEIHSYDLHFDFQMPEIGIDSYTAQMKLRADGTIISDINLPSFGKSPEKEKLIGLNTALQVAKLKGFDPEKVEAEIIYEPKGDLLVWRFSQVFADDGLVRKIKYIDISAHSSKVIATFTNRSIR